VPLEIGGREEGHLHALPVAAPQHSGGAHFVNLAVPSVIRQQLHYLAAVVALEAVPRTLVQLHVFGHHAGKKAAGMVTGEYWTWCVHILVVQVERIQIFIVQSAFFALELRRHFVHGIWWGILTGC
jgi:hypothetical protein